MVLARLAVAAAGVFRSQPEVLAGGRPRERRAWFGSESQSKRELRLRETQHTAGCGALRLSCRFWKQLLFQKSFTQRRKGIHKGAKQTLLSAFVSSLCAFV